MMIIIMLVYGFVILNLDLGKFHFLYGTKNKGEDKEIAHSTHLSWSIGEGIREEMKHIFINSSPSLGRGKISTF